MEVKPMISSVRTRILLAAVSVTTLTALLYVLAAPYPNFG